MNEQNAKKILFNKSTLLSLKAELMKKQEEVQEKKRLPHHKLENFKPSAPKSNEYNVKKPDKSFKHNLKANDTEEMEACRKAKFALEKKAVLYDHLSDGIGTSQLTERFLVDFNTKKQQESRKSPTLEPAAEILISNNNHSHDDDDDDEWTDYTDCLGRTRRCLKTDLELYKKRDLDLLRAIGKDTNKNLNEDLSDTKQMRSEEEPGPSVEKPLLVQETNNYLQSLRDKWEERERELLAKDGDVHYQDVLFDEARMHGVSYFSFSTDETERRKQMAELMRTREETLRAQQEAEEKRKKRDELIAARVAAARARQRMRAGLPLEDPEENKKDFTTCLLEFLNQHKNAADAKAKEEEQKLKEEREKEREKLRQTYIREWDVGKDGVGDKKLEKFRELSQEEYEDQQRDKRIKEFAPPQSSSKAISKGYFNEKGKLIDSELSPSTKTWADVRQVVQHESTSIDLNEQQLSQGLFFSSSKNQEGRVKYKNFVRAQESIPIINEIKEDERESQEKLLEKRKATEHATIAPPPTFDYYGPVAKQSRTNVPFTSDLREAYAQGVKVLQPKEDKLRISKQYDFTF